MANYGGEAEDYIEPVEISAATQQSIYFFLDVITQWRVSEGTYIGLDYSVVLPMMEINGIEDKKQMLSDIKVMEFSALAILNKGPQP